MTGLRDVLALVGKVPVGMLVRTLADENAEADLYLAAVNYLRANGPELMAVLGECRKEVQAIITAGEEQLIVVRSSEYARLTALLARIDALIGARGDG